MKTTIRVSAEIEADLPQIVGGFTLSSLRAMHREKVRALKEIYPGDVHTVSLTFFCDAEERLIAGDLPGFVPAHHFSKGAERLDFGACEVFRFKWKHEEKH